MVANDMLFILRRMILKIFETYIKYKWFDKL